VVESLFSQAMCGALVARVENRRVALSEPRLQILEGVLSARPQKTLALEMNLAASTIAMHARLGLQTIGSSGNPSRAHPLLMLAAMTAVGAAAAAIATETLITHGASELSVLWIARPDLELDRVLTSSEAAVVRFLVEGESYAAIAAARRTSKRTVANQVAAVFKRYGVSGRNQLVARLLRGADARP
jgi:DNA-binding CsgD family transcriptional regulator